MPAILSRLCLSSLLRYSDAEEVKLSTLSMSTTPPAVRYTRSMLTISMSQLYSD